MDHNKPTYEELTQHIFELEGEIKKLREVGQFSNSIVEFAQDGIVVYGRDLHYQVWNPFMEKLTGKSADQAIGKHPLDLFPFLKKSGVIERVEKVLQGEPVTSFDYPSYDPELKKIRWTSDKCAPIKNVDGEIIGVIGIIRDITEQKKNEDAAKNIQIFNETILSRTPDVIYVYDIIKKENVYSNEGINKVLGYTISEIKEFGENLIESIMHPDDFSSYRSKILPRYIECRDDETIEHQYRMKHKSGDWQWLHSRESIFLRKEDGTPQQIFGIISDITKQKQDENIIFNSEKEYRSLFNKMLDGFALHEIICDADGLPVDYRFLKLNPAFEAQTGLKANDLIGRTVLDAMPGTEKYWIDTYGKVALTGEAITFNNYSAPLDKHFKVTAYCPQKNQFACIFQDITERIKAEIEKINYESQLRQAHKMEALGTLAGGIAHDFNNILAAILGYADMARDDIPAYSPAKYQIDEVLKAGNRAKDLVKHILSFSRKEVQSQVPVEVYSILQDALKFLRVTIPANIDFKESFDSNYGNILANATQIHQVIINLCTNAAQAMEENGGVLEVSSSYVKLSENELKTETEVKAGCYALLQFKDNGPGIDPQNIDRIFDPYFTTKEVGKGSGMGLAVVIGIVKSHDGHITVVSQPGEGTTFRVYFPRIEDKADKKVVEKSPIPIGNESILIVDDDASIANLTLTRLERLGYHAKAMTSSTETLELFREDPNAYDLVITDQTMPKMTGEQLAKELFIIRPNIPVIMCTGYSSRIDADKANSIGIRAFIMKPVDYKDLSRTIRNILDSN